MHRSGWSPFRNAEISNCCARSLSASTSPGARSIPLEDAGRGAPATRQRAARRDEHYRSSRGLSLFSGLTNQFCQTAGRDGRSSTALAVAPGYNHTLGALLGGAARNSHWIMALIAIPIRAARRYGKPTFAAVTRVERSPARDGGAFLFVVAVTAATDRGKVTTG